MRKSLLELTIETPNRIEAEVEYGPGRDMVSLIVSEGNSVYTVTMAQEAWVKACTHVLLLIKGKETHGQREPGT